MDELINAEDWWSRIYEISTLLNYSVPDYENTLALIVDTVIDLTQAERGILVLFDEDDQTHIAITRRNDQTHITNEQEQQLILQILERVLTEVQQDGELFWISNIIEDERFDTLSDVIVQLKLKSVMCIPLKIILRENDKRLMQERRQISLSHLHDVIGFVCVDSSEKFFSPSKQELMFVQALTNQATIALINSQLYQQVTTDELTSVTNRRYFEQLLIQEKRIATQNQTPFSLMIIDVDGFQRVNRKYGHRVGDRVLREVAQTIRQSVRRADIVARYGGDIFVLLCPQTDLDGGKVVAEQVRLAVENAQFETCDLPITVSIGLAVYPEHTSSRGMLIKCVDQALYQAKSDGGNCYQIWSPLYQSPTYRSDRLVGVLTGNTARDYRNVVMLLDMIQVMSTTIRLDELMTTVIDMIIEIMDAERGLFFTLYDIEGEQRLVLSIARDNQHQTISSPIYNQPIPDAVFRSGIPICFTNNTQSDEMIVDDLEKTPSLLGLHAVLCVLLQVKDHKVGVIYIDSQNPETELSLSDLAFLECLADQIAIAVENARLYDQLQKTNQKLSDAFEELKTLDTMKLNFITNISHELRTPLSSIIASSELMSSNPEFPPEKIQKFADAILQQSRRLSTIADDIIYIAEEEAEQSNWNLGTMQLGDTVRQVYYTMQDEFENNNIEFKLICEPNLPVIHGDNYKLHLVITKLLDNAYKFTPPEGQVIVEVKQVEQMIEFSVMDTGKGIPLEEQKHIFTRFYQAGDILTEKPHGTGLGLSICEEIIIKHRGQIWVESPYKLNNQLQKGSKFTFVIPI